MDVAQSEFTLVAILAEFGFAITAVIGLAYFIYYIWNFVSKEIDPKIEEMHIQLIRVIDQVRMLDNDLIRLQQKVNTVVEYRKQQEAKDEANNVPIRSTKSTRK